MPRSEPIRLRSILTASITRIQFSLTYIFINGGKLLVCLITFSNSFILSQGHRAVDPEPFYHVCVRRENILQRRHQSLSVHHAHTLLEVGGNRGPHTEIQ